MAHKTEPLEEALAVIRDLRTEIREADIWKAQWRKIHAIHHREINDLQRKLEKYEAAVGG